MIEFKDIKLVFGEKEVFNGFNLKINKGEKVLLSAPSGKGKSSLAKMLLGFQKPDSGHVVLDGKVLDKKTLGLFRSKIAYVSQDVDLRDEKVSELLKEIFGYKVNSEKINSYDNVLALFNRFNLSEEIMDKDVSNLSGGERQRLGLVICSLLDREVWILDEVTSGLDEELKRATIEYIVGTDKTVIVISHDTVWLENENVRVERW